MSEHVTAENLMEYISRRWVEPEIQRRKANDTLPSELGIKRCRVLIPNNGDPIVQFNDEIGWTARMKKPIGIAFNAGDLVHLSQVEYVERVFPPTINGERVAFYYVFFTGKEWKIVFDGPPTDNPGLDADNWYLSDSIADEINSWLKELAVLRHDNHHAELRLVGLWPAPALLPFPISEMTEHCKNGHLQKARDRLLVHCTPDFIARKVSTWSIVPEFEIRMTLINEAMCSHREKRYTQCISALVPQIEGVVTDWIYTKVPTGIAIPWKQGAKTKKFHEIITAEIELNFTKRRVLECAIDFITNGPVMRTFNEWSMPIGEEFPNRHMIGHGKFEPAIYTEENSIKVFLMLDTLFNIMKDAALDGFNR